MAWVKASSGSHLMGLRFVNADEELCKALGKLVEDAFRSIERDKG